jgi:TatD DNase family protein
MDKMFIDSHAHLDMPQFDDDRESVIERAHMNGVELIITVGTNLQTSSKAVEIADTFENVYAAVGFHPHDVKSIRDGDYEEIKKLASHNKVVAYGEIGLDFYKNLSPKELQIKRMREQIQIARELKLPIIIHDRDAHREILQILREEKGWINGGVIHCFSGDQLMAKKCMDMGLYLSIPGTITFNKASRLKNLILCLGLERILIETDCPFLAPVPFRGKRNEPAYVRYVAEKIAKLKKMEVEEVAHTTTQNVKELFHFKKEFIDRSK